MERLGTFETQARATVHGDVGSNYGRWKSPQVFLDVQPDGSGFNIEEGTYKRWRFMPHSQSGAYLKQLSIQYLIALWWRQYEKRLKLLKVRLLNPDCSFLELSKWKVDDMGVVKLGLFLSLAWAFWTIKNKVILGSGNPSATVLVDSFTRLVKDYKVYFRKVHFYGARPGPKIWTRSQSRLEPGPGFLEPMP